MLDTMRLVLTDYEVRNPKLTLTPASIDTETGEMKGNYLLWREGNRAKEGKEAHHRDGHFNANIRPDRNTDGTGPKSFCIVNFEVPKFAGGNNFKPVDYQGTKDAFQQAERMLKDIGIHTNIRTAQASRLDTFRNAIVSEPFSNFRSVLLAMQGSRMKQQEYGDGVLWKNGRSQVIAYDKCAQLLYKKESVVGLPSNALRAELRSLEASKVRDVYGFKNVQELLDGYDGILDVYRQSLKKLLFKYSVPELEVIFASELEAHMRFCEEHYGRNWFQKFLMEVGMQCLVQKSSIETVVQVLDKVADNKMQKSRLKRDLQKIRFSAAAASMVPACNRTNGELYNELQEKLLGA